MCYELPRDMIRAFSITGVMNLKSDWLLTHVVHYRA